MKPGDVVRLRSGGVKMTVEKLDEQSEHIHVVWFDEQNNLRRDRVPSIMLEPAEAIKRSEH